MPIGKINRIPIFEKDKKPRYFAFIDDKYFFHVSQYKGNWRDLVNLMKESAPVTVKYEIDEPGPKGELRAKDVELV